MNSLFALIDCNNFFASCEVLFRPDLAGKPVVVLSSNDGCVVARSNAAKALGIAMGAPAFNYRDLFAHRGVVPFSANFELYGDISQRITRLLTGLTPRTEVYSVDESFLELAELPIGDYRAWGSNLRQRILREVGIPVSVGIAPTKTLAKLAAEHAKRVPALQGVLDLATIPLDDLARYLQTTPIADIWGIGRRLAPKLRAEGLHTAFAVSELRPRFAQQLMGIRGRQLVAELNGTSCYPLEPPLKPRQSIMHGRIFGSDTNQFSVIEAAITNLTARSTLPLRREHLLARSAVVSLSTNRHKPGYCSLSRILSFPTPSADTGVIASQLLEALAADFNPQASYHRANVLLYDLIDERTVQSELLQEPQQHTVRLNSARMQAVDALNRRYGTDTVRFAAEDLSQAWRPKHNTRSPRYTTQWQELPIARLSAL